MNVRGGAAAVRGALERHRGLLSPLRVALLLMAMAVSLAALAGSGTAQGQSAVLYMTGSANDWLYTVNTTTGVATRVGTATQFGVSVTGPAGLAYHGGVLYMQGGSKLYAVNTTTGVATRVGTSSFFGVSENAARGLGSHGGMLYMTGSANDWLYTVNTTTGAATRVGTATQFGVSEASPGGLASHGGVLYMTGLANDWLYTVNTTTGAATRVGTSTQFGVSEASPYGLASHGGVLYMTGYANDWLYTVNTTTGAATRVGTSTQFGVSESDPRELASTSSSTAAATRTPTDEATWESDETEVTVQVPGAVTVTSGTGAEKTVCARWDDGDPLELTLFGVTVEMYGVCVHRQGGTDPWDLELHYSSGERPDLGRLSDMNVLESLAVYEPVGGVNNLVGKYHGNWADLALADGSLGSTTTVRTDESSSAYSGCTASATGFQCSSDAIMDVVLAGDYLNLVLELSDTPADLMDAGTAGQPSQVSAIRSSDTEVTVAWTLYDPAAEYEIERLEGVEVTVGGSTRIEYSNLETFSVSGTVEGVNEYVDSSVEVETSYQYRVRARRDSWGEWSEYVLSAAAPPRDQQDPPTAVTLDRALDESEIEIGWIAPDGAFDNYTIQRQALVVIEGSTFFSDPVNLPATGWIDGDAVSYTDSTMVPGEVYEYRVAAVTDDIVGVYTEWIRSAPVESVFGEPPEDLKVTEDVQRADRREVWLGWDEVDGADDYQVQAVGQKTDGTQTIDSYLVTDNSYFATVYFRHDFRVRGRYQDAGRCGAGAADRCYTGWSAWLSVQYVPRQTFPTLAPAATPDASTMKLRDTLTGLIDDSFESTGLTVNGEGALNGMVIISGYMMAALCFVVTWRVGMAPLGVGMGAAMSIMWIWLGIRLVGLPIAWGVAGITLVMVGGAAAFVVMLGLTRRN